MTYMAVVVGGDTADVHFDMIVSQRLELSFSAGSRIIYVYRHLLFHFRLKYIFTSILKMDSCLIRLCLICNKDHLMAMAWINFFKQWLQEIRKRIETESITCYLIKTDTC